MALMFGLGCGLAVSRRVILKNPVGESPCDLDQRFGARLGYTENPGGVVRRAESAVDFDRLGHTVRIIEYGGAEEDTLSNAQMQNPKSGSDRAIVTTASDEMRVSATVVALQTFGHEARITGMDREKM